MSAINEGRRPFPALTPEQRLYLDVNGYVIIPNALSDNEVKELLETIYGIERSYRETGQLPGPNCHLSSDREDYFRIDNLPHLADSFFRYLTHPYIVGMAEEIVGGSVRLEQSDAHIRRPVDVGGGPHKYGFHRGINPGFSHVSNGLYHFTFVKALTNLTDLGPDDGGTVVVAGSHKVQRPEEEIVACAYEDRSLIHQVVAPAGSSFLFGEALVHATGHVLSDRERVIVFAGYTPPMFQAWNGQEPSPGFVERVPEEHRPLISGSDKWRWQRRHRTLDQPAEPWPRGDAH